MHFTSTEVMPFLFHRVDLQQDGKLITKLSDAEAMQLCRLNFVRGIMSARKVEGGEKVPVLRYLELIVSVRKLKTVLGRVVVRSLQSVAEDSRTFMRTKFGIQHDLRKCRLYKGGPTRLGVVVIAAPA